MNSGMLADIGDRLAPAPTTLRNLAIHDDEEPNIGVS